MTVSMSGINVAGFFQSEKGLGEGVRSDLRAFDAAGIHCTLTDFIDPYATESINSEIYSFSDQNPHRINLLHFNPDVLHLFLQQHGDAYLAGRYNIGYWAWELEDYPEPWREEFRRFDEIWVPSRFTLDAVSRVSPLPVVRVPHCLHPRLIAGVAPNRSRFGFESTDFVFLFLFDFASVLERKNPLGLIRAFKRAFPSDRDALLVLKTLRGRDYPDHRRELEAAAVGARIRILDEPLSRDDAYTILASADCYVSLHRSEGFGLTMAESMALGKPVIGTGYSGNLDFMTSANSRLVDYHLATIEEDHGLYAKGCFWAEPDFEHAASLMREMKSSPDAGRRVGATARAWMVDRFSPDAVGRIVRTRVERICEWIGGAPQGALPGTTSVAERP